MIEVDNLTKTFKMNNGALANVINGANATFNDGEFASIIGKSGSGKSTLLSLLGTLDQPTDGSILIDGQDVKSLRGKSLTDYRCRQVGFVFQNYQLIPNLTALENVCLPMEFAGVNRAARVSRAMKLLSEVDIIGDKVYSRPGKLSGGEQQRVAIARALSNNPSMILADEPTGNLDETTAKKIFDLLSDLSKSEKVTIVVVTHDLDIAGKTDVSYRLKNGKLDKA